jgi:2-dehydro-3-deoxyphosphogluconate aldolase / (4S)-4-hydroxy-2-oxoglutarate aldolase
MNTKSKLLQLIIRQGVLPLYYCDDADVSIKVMKALYSAGIRTVEYTNRGENALANFKKMHKVCDKELKGMYLGVGTIKNEKSAKTFMDAGADYIISPGLIEEVAALADKKNMLWIPGCMTSTEIIHAENMGAKFIKLFPGNILGPGFMSAIKDLFPALLFMPTGGVEIDKENIAAWFKAGVAAVGMGSKLISKELMEQKDYATIEALTRQALDIVRQVR